MGGMQTTLRERLRTGTRAAHDDVDHAFAPHDLAKFPGYVAFLRSHAKALKSLTPDPALPTRLRCRISLDIGLIAHDLTQLGAALPDGSLCETRHHHPIAVEYVLLGSSMGLRVLSKRWGRSSDPRVLGTSSFLRSDRSKEWRPFCNRLTAMPATGAIADRVVLDSQRIFSAFARAARSEPNLQEHKTYDDQPLAAE